MSNRKNPVILNLFQDPFLPASGVGNGELASPLGSVA